ncbi:MAG: hypothetical protein CSA81_07385 [Acidobacteria bacterium]|nr:MAG: hypothetical protein CSA81_07385 [Acidobacteriota bacterium]
MKETLWSFISHQLQKGPVMLQIVTQHRGSSPGKKGAKMAHSLDGASFGSVGGGIMEHELMKRGQHMLAREVRAYEHVSLEHRPDSACPGTLSSGLMCMGSQKVLLIPLYPEHRRQFEQLTKDLQAGHPMDLICRDNSIRFVKRNPSAALEASDYGEKLNRLDEIFIFGDGHIGNAIAAMCSFLEYDYYQFPTPRDDEALRADLVKGMHFKELIKESEKPYAVVVTSSAPTDLKCLKALLSCELTYCGILGSAKKIKYLLGELNKEEKQAAWLESVHAPIGLPIGSQTPAEIAVSIMAEIIACIRGVN